MPYKEKEIKKLYYSIGEVAKMFDVSTSLIRFWESEFTILKPRKNSKGNRMYTEKDIDMLMLIYHLVKERGYTLDGAKKKLKENKSETVNHFAVVKSLKKIRSFLKDIQENLEQV